jgi:hypothetical protein
MNYSSRHLCMCTFQLSAFMWAQFLLSAFKVIIFSRVFSLLVSMTSEELCFILLMELAY